MIKAVIFDMFETLISHYRTQLYFGEEIAADIGMSSQDFLMPWRAAEQERTLGQIRTDRLIENIMKKNACYSREVLDLVMAKRIEAKRSCFKNMRADIKPCLEKIKDLGLKLSLISNCFSEEAEVIRESEIAKYFDALYLSCELHMAKPDSEIFIAAAKGLSVLPSECLYVGDGGSGELAAAEAVGMRPLQAGWYLTERGVLSEFRLCEYELLQKPQDIFKFLF